MSAPEPSGDLHAAKVVTALKNLIPDIWVEGVGGTAMSAAGADIIEPFDQLGAVGTLESIGSLPAHLRLLSRLRRALRAGRYDLVLLVDYPGFHLRVASAAAAADVPVLYYIAPQLWAWGAWRLDKLRDTARTVAVILPFEEAYFRDRGVDARFVGHPLLDADAAPSVGDARKRMGISSRAPVLGLFPGVRNSEVARLWPVLRDAAERLRDADPDIQVVVAAAPGLEYPGDAEARVAHGRSRDVIAAADVILCKSGTTTLEAALAGTPMVIAYRMHPVTHALARRLVRVSRVGLVNLLGCGDVAPEFIQDDATPLALAEAVRPLVDRDGEPARAQRTAFSNVRRALGEPGAAARVANMVTELL